MVSIVPRWQQLASMNPESPDFLPLLSSLTAEVNRSPATMLGDGDAWAVLSAMDKVSPACAAQVMTYITSSAQVLRGGKISDEHERDILCMMQALAYFSGQVPFRYQIDRQSLSVESHAVAGGAFTGVREGKLWDRTVVVKSLITDRRTGLHQIQKVRTVSN